VNPHKRQLLVAMTTAGIATAGLGAAVLPASAEPRTFQVTLVDGRTLVLTVDAPAGTPADQVAFPGVTDPIASVTELAPPAPAPAPPAEPAPAPPAPAATTPAAPPSPAPAPPPPARDDGGADAEEPDADAGERPDERAEEDEPAERTRGGRYGRERPAPRPRPATPAPAPAAPGAPAAPAPAAPAPPAGPTAPLPGLGSPAVGVPNLLLDSFRIPPFLCRSTRPPASSTACAGRSSRRSTRSRRTTGAT
jgi:pyruvate/2-oxoglutarate dehydrogenase complex dihydrolipoamide acyltransferase (E2) component